MIKTNIYTLLLLPFLLSLGLIVVDGGSTLAKEAYVEEIRIKHAVEAKTVDRQKVIEKYLEKRNSPLVGHAETFVAVADQYDMDYRLLVAIACLESSCGIHMPYESNNAWGWGVYGTNVIRFNDFDEGIKTVGSGLYEGYILKGANTPDKISKKYNPPTSESWAGKIHHFMREMDKEVESTISLI